MTDLRFEVGSTRFQVRVHLLHMREDHLLVVTLPDSTFWFLPGGTVQTGETLSEAAAREWQEETGTEATALRLAGIVEGFDRPGRRQQLGFCFLVEASGLPSGSFPVRDEPTLRAEWVPLAELETRPVHPVGLRVLLDRQEIQLWQTEW